MTNSAVALVLSPAVDSVETYIVNTAAGFSFADSTYDFSLSGGQKCGAAADRICGNLAKNFPFGVLSDIIGKHTIRSGRANGLFI